MKHIDGRRLGIYGLAWLGLALGACTASTAQEATIRKNLAERVPVFEKIDAVSKTPMKGLWEVQAGGEVFYTDAKGDFLLHGTLIDTKTRSNLTEARLQKLNAIAFADLPLKNAFVIKRGKGTRKLAVFTDPNCPYCKRVEQELAKVDDVTIHVFVYPILGAGSTEKARHTWCASDRAKVWQDMMLRGINAPAAQCDSRAVDENVAFGQKNRITGTPTLIFADGVRVPGAMSAEQIDKQLAAAR